MNYPKIQTLWKRDPNNKMNIIEGQFSLPEFKLITEWIAQEKIDGTNTRVHLSPDNPPQFYGKNDKSTLPNFLVEKLQLIFPEDTRYDGDLWLFGEGHGPKIQKFGEYYAPEVDFCLFDVNLNGVWQNINSCKSFSKFFNIKHVPVIETHVYNNYAINEIIDLIKGSPTSVFAYKNCPMEGFVLKTDPVLLQANGNPLYFKLKVSDYLKLNNG